MMAAILAAVMAVLVTFLSVIAYIAALWWPPWRDATGVVVATVLLPISLYAFRRVRCWPTALLLIGAVPLFILRLHDFLIGYLVEHNNPLVGPGSFWFRTCTENPALVKLFAGISLVGFCFPLGLLVLTFQATRKHLTNR
jgi:hypothetical protein